MLPSCSWKSRSPPQSARQDSRKPEHVGRLPLVDAIVVDGRIITGMVARGKTVGEVDVISASHESKEIKRGLACHEVAEIAEKRARFLLLAFHVDDPKAPVCITEAFLPMTGSDQRTHRFRPRGTPFGLLLGRQVEQVPIKVAKARSPVTSAKQMSMQVLSLILGKERGDRYVSRRTVSRLEGVPVN